MTPQIHEYNFKVTVLQSGQQRRYGDSYFEYEVETNAVEFVVKQFCTKVLRPCKNAYTDWARNKEKSAAEYFAGYYTFERIGDNKYRYKVTEPYCD